MPEWFFPILGIIGAIIGSTVIVTAAIFTKFAAINEKFSEITLLILNNHNLMEVSMSSHRAQIAESLEAIRQRLSKVEWTLGRINGHYLQGPDEKKGKQE